MNPVSRSRIDDISEWFSSLDDGDLCVHPSSIRSTCIGDSSEPRSIIYTTKIACMPRILSMHKFQQPVVTIGRYGLPVEDDVEAIRKLAGSSRLIFIGDADPPDILTFAWLREHLPFEWYGVNDRFLFQHGNLDNTKIPIRLSEIEVSAAANLSEWCPNFRELLGYYCTSLLGRGLKIEVEGAILA